jgi:hypothetical protein
MRKSDGQAFDKSASYVKSQCAQSKSPTPNITDLFTPSPPTTSPPYPYKSDDKTPHSPQKCSSPTTHQPSPSPYKAALRTSSSPLSPPAPRHRCRIPPLRTAARGRRSARRAPRCGMRRSRTWSLVFRLARGRGGVGGEGVKRSVILGVGDLD